MRREQQRLRVALLAGTLAQGGAEKQLVYMARALLAAGVDVRVYTLRAGEHYEAALLDAGLAPIWVGRHASPAVRLLAFTRELRRFRPQIVQAAHFYVNLYVTLAARATGAAAIGALRCDGAFDVGANGRWGGALLRRPPALLANSEAARAYAVEQGVSRDRVSVIPNVLDDRPAEAAAAAPGRIHVVAVARLAAAKRLDRFLDALARVRETLPTARGTVAGAGPERAALERHAAALGLTGDALRFVGHCGDVPALLGGSDILVISSDHEGFPNVALEAMGAGLPVVTTPAGDAAVVVQDGTTGFVVGFDDAAAMAERITRLAASPGLRQRMGAAGRRRAQEEYGPAHLADRLLAVYAAAAAQQRSGAVPEAACPA